MNSSCPLRPVPCPFVDLGCSVPLLHKDVPAHIDSCGNSHLLLAIEIVRSQRNSMEEMALKIRTLEEGAQDMSGSIHKLTMGAAAALTAIEVSERKTYHRLHDDITKIDKKLTDSTTKIANDVSSLTRAHGKTSGQVASLQQQMTPIAAAVNLAGKR